MQAFDTNALLDAFDEIGLAAIAAETRLELAVYGGSALMIAGNFRFSTEDVDIAQLRQPWPVWLADAVARIAARRSWAADWLNEAVSFHLSQYASLQDDHILFGTFPRGADATGLVVHVPTARYMLALKLKAMRINDPGKGAAEKADIGNLLEVTQTATVEEAMGILRRYFPKSAKAGERQRFFLKHIFFAQTPEGDRDAPQYPVGRRDPPASGAAGKADP